MSEPTELIAQAYMAATEARNYRGRKVESGQSYAIHWFVWERDGIYPWPDWEPIVFVFCDSNLMFVCVRRHFKWEVYEATDLVEPVTILFDGRQHAPYVKTKTNSQDFINKVSRGTIPVPLDREVGEEVPDFARDPRRLRNHFGTSAIPAVLWQLISRQKTVDEKVRELLKDCQ